MTSTLSSITPSNAQSVAPSIADDPKIDQAKEEQPADGQWRSLLDQDLSNFEVWMGIPHQSVQGLPEGTFQAEKVTKGQPMGLDADVKNVFAVTVVNEEPVLKISGEIYGGLTTLEDFGDYHFSTQFKWGDKKWEPRLNRLRDSGILYHCTGKHGAFWEVWKSSVEYQVQETDLGDLYPLGGTSAEVRATDGKYDPESEQFARRGMIKAGSEPDAPHGQWNRLEVYTLGTTSVHVANDVVVMVLENLKIRGKPLSRGQIQIQSEAAECYYKDMKIRSISDFPADIKSQMRLR
ncbi:3-keto-disaccharide hydrolase [Rubripirellula obstinata]|uniref:3-keto-disaccharide hydrolase n=1 Tax=Rubripirellula obstinata TaxID=406547 RepID=UPI001F407ECE|nr:DUF1080 domain-containing protein [Rubripirellula obstinata]